jgi:hypothetical protein
MIQRDMIEVKEATTSEDIARDVRLFRGRLSLGAAYQVDQRAMADIGVEFIESEIRRRIMEELYGDLEAALSVLDIAFSAWSFGDALPVSKALGILRAHVDEIRGAP